MVFTFLVGDLQGKEGVSKRLLPKPPRITVPYTAIPPVLDGKINSKEWHQASLVTGFHCSCGVLAGKILPVKVYLMHNDHALYIAMQCIHTGAKTQVRSNDRASTGDKICWTEDDIEIFLQPFGDTKSYMLMANPDGEQGDLILGPSPKYNRDWSWKGNWEIKTHKEDKNWEAEICIPFSDFDRGTPTEGEIWRANFAQTCKVLNSWASWSHGGLEQRTPFHPADRFGELLFTRVLPAVRCPEWLVGQEVKQGHMACSLELVGQSADTSIRCSIALDNRFSETEVIQRDVVVSTGKGTTVEMIGNTSVHGLYLVRIKAETNGIILFQQEYPYEVDGRMLKTELVYWPSCKELHIEISPNPYQLPKNSPETIRVRCRMVDQSGHHIVRRGQSLVKAGEVQKIVFSLGGLSPGRYRIITDAPELPRPRNYLVGDYLYEEYFDYRGEPDWLFKGRHLACIEQPIAPWTPVKMEGRTFHCWGREYRFGKHLLPEQIISQGKLLLKAPICFVLEEGKKSHVVRNVRTKVESANSCEAVLSGKGRIGNFDICVRAHMEFDGFAWFDCEFIPHGEVLVNRLTLEIPLNAEHAPFYMTQGMTIGNTEGDVQKRIKPDAYRVRAYQSHFVTENLFFGDGKVGLSWCVESDKNWINRTPEKALEIFKRKNQVLFRCNIIDTPWKISKPFTISFSLTASPVRPLRPGWQSYAISYSRWPQGKMVYVSSARPVMPMHFDSGGADGQYQSTPDARDPDLLHAAIKKVHQYGNLICPYLCCTHIHDRDPIFDLFKNEWSNGVTSRDRETYLMYRDDSKLCRINLFADSWRDYFLTLFKNYLAEFDVDGFYFDNSFVDATYNPRHSGHSYTDVFGRKKYIRPVRKLRELYKGTYILAHQARGDHAYIIRGYGSCNLAYMSFADAYVSEHYVLGGIKDFIDEVPWERALLFYSPHRGIPTHIIPFLDRTPERITRATKSMLAQNIQTRALLWNIMCDTSLVRKFEAAVQDFFPYDPRFISNEEISSAATTDSRNIKICAYVLSDRTMLGISNFGNRDSDIKIHLNPEFFGLPSKGLRAVDLITKKSLPFEQDHLLVHVDGKSFVLVGLTAGPEKEMEKLLRNGSFENLFHRNGIGMNWRQVNDRDDTSRFSLSRRYAHSGAVSQMIMTSTGNGIWQICPCEKNRHYRIHAWIYVVKGKALLLVGHPQNHRAYGTIETNQTGKWQKLELQAKSVKDSIIVKIVGAKTGEETQFYVDDVSIIKIDST